MFSSKLSVAAVVLTTMSLTGCSTLGFSDAFKSETTSQYMKQARSTSIYDTSGFGYTAPKALKQAMRNSKNVCQQQVVKVVGESAKTITHHENDKKVMIHVVDMSYRCIK